MIETERLLLRPFTKNDAGDVFEYLHEPLVNCFACMKLNTMEDAKEEVENRAKDIEYYFAIVLKDTGKVIGEIVAHPETHTPEEDNVVLDTFSPCWMLNKDYQGKGYAMKQPMLILTIYFLKKVQDASMLIQKIIIFLHSICVKNWACDVRECLWSSCHLSMMQKEIRFMRIPFSMQC